ncbi:hypothetical protein ABNQ39_00110 (plasmid) [Azospirillum sp. A26]|uniref:hypothetical protein n=1 Tax=Azospirillum sp. A26 TaxID=3160607 RepID=UPI00366EE207
MDQRAKAGKMLADCGYARGGKVKPMKVTRAKSAPPPPMPKMAAPMGEPDGDEAMFKRGGRVKKGGC